MYGHGRFVLLDAASFNLSILRQLRHFGVLYSGVIAVLGKWRYAGFVAGGDLAAQSFEPLSCLMLFFYSLNYFIILEI
jgi:hypothetical protein